MRSVALRLEYVAAMQRTPVEIVRELQHHNVPMRAITLVCPAFLKITLDGDSLFRPDPTGKPALVVMACVADGDCPDCIETDDPEFAISLGATIDLVAFSPQAPGRFALRCGAAAVLGSIKPQYCNPAPVPVHRGVMSWLRSGCRGIVLLTRDRIVAGGILRGISHLEADSIEHAAELRRLMAMPTVETVVTTRPACRVAT
jgi:hypothetical protein